MNNLPLTKRRALIAGASGVIGRAVSYSLASKGAEIIAIDLPGINNFEMAQGLPAPLGQSHQGLDCDFTEENTIRKICSNLDSLDIIVHCIGITSANNSIVGYNTPVEDQTVDAFRQALNVNVTSAFVLAQAVAPLVHQSPHGSFVLISSIYGLRGPMPGLYDETDMSNPVAYGVSKGGLQQMASYLAVEWAPEVRVNCVSPGGLKANQPPKFIQRYEKRTPLKRMATAEDIAGPVAFLASDESRYVTGHNLVVDGGWTCT